MRKQRGVSIFISLAFLFILAGSVSAAIAHVHIEPQYPNLDSTTIKVYADVFNITKATLYYIINDSTYSIGDSPDSSRFSISKGFASISYSDISDNIQVFYWIEAINSSKGKESTGEFSFTYDGSAPSTTDNASNAWGNQNISVMLSCSDSISGCNETYYSINDSNLTNFILYNSSFDLTQEGQYQLEYYSTDNAGNKEDAVSGTLVKIDRTKPTTTDDAPNTSSSQPVTITLSCYDNLSLCNQTYYSTDNSTTFILYSGPFTLSSSGQYQLKYYSTDNAGNKEDTVSGTLVLLDIPSPAPSGGGGGGGGFVGNSIVTNVKNTSTVCIERWICNEWEGCANGKQTRTCTDVALCGTTKDKPSLSQLCNEANPTPQNKGFLRTVGGVIISPVSFVFSNLARALIFLAVLIIIGGFLVFKFAFKGDLKNLRKWLLDLKKEIQYKIRVRRKY